MIESIEHAPHNATTPQMLMEIQPCDVPLPTPTLIHYQYFNIDFCWQLNSNCYVITFTDFRRVSKSALINDNFKLRLNQAKSKSFIYYFRIIEKKIICIYRGSNPYHLAIALTLLPITPPCSGRSRALTVDMMKS